MPKSSPNLGGQLKEHNDINNKGQNKINRQPEPSMNRTNTSNSQTSSNLPKRDNKIYQHCSSLYKKLMTHPNIMLVKDYDKTQSKSKERLSFTQIEKKIESGEYKDKIGFYKDVRSIWTNYFNIYIEDNSLYQKVNTLNLYFENLINEANFTEEQETLKNEVANHHNCGGANKNPSSDQNDRLENKHKSHKSSTQHHQMSDNNKEYDSRKFSNNHYDKHRYENKEKSDKERHLNRDLDKNHNNGHHKSKNEANTMKLETTPKHTPNTNRKVIDDDEEDENPATRKTPPPNSKQNGTSNNFSSKSNNSNKEVSSNSSSSINKKPALIPLKKTIIGSNSTNTSSSNTLNKPLQISPPSLTEKHSMNKVQDSTPKEAITLPKNKPEEVAALKKLIETNQRRLNKFQKENLVKIANDLNNIERDSKEQIVELDIDLLSSKKIGQLITYINDCLVENNKILEEKQAELRKLEEAKKEKLIKETKEKVI